MKIIDERSSNKRLTIFISNLTFEEIRSIFKDGRFPNRLESMALFVKMSEENICVKLVMKKKDDIVKGIIE